MNRLIQVGRLAVLFTSAAFFCVAAYELRQLVVHADKTLSQVDVTLGTINRPCAAKDAKGNMLPPGTLCSIDKSITRITDIATETQVQESQTGNLVLATTRNLDVVAANANGAITDARKLLTAGTGTATAASGLLGAANDALAAYKAVPDRLNALLDSSAATVNTANRLLADPNIPAIMENVNGITLHSEGILTTTDLVWKRATRNYLYPSKNPWARLGVTLKPFIVPAAQVGGALAIEIH